MTQDLQQAAIRHATAVQQKYSDWLMSLPGVVGVAVGFATEGGQPTGVIALIVMVAKKRPVGELDPKEIIPPFLDNVRVDVQETGIFTAGAI
ncbi:MAG: hypothetical protein U0670_03035 [Anaerolineae bacterium]